MTTQPGVTSAGVLVGDFDGTVTNCFRHAPSENER
jgi:hypothetical protein